MPLESRSLEGSCMPQCRKHECLSRGETLAWGHLSGLSRTTETQKLFLQLRIRTPEC